MKRRKFNQRRIRRYIKNCGRILSPDQEAYYEKAWHKFSRQWRTPREAGVHSHRAELMFNAGLLERREIAAPKWQQWFRQSF